MEWIPLFVLVICAWLLFFGGIDTIAKRFGKNPEVRKLDPVEYAWGDGKDLTSLLDTPDPEAATLLADSTFSRIEREWEKAHPTEADKVRDQLTKKLEAKSIENISLTEQVRNMRRVIAVKDEKLGNLPDKYGSDYNRVPDHLVEIPDTITEAQYQEFVKQYAIELAKVAEIQGKEIVRIPSMTVASPKNKYGSMWTEHPKAITTQPAIYQIDDSMSQAEIDNVKARFREAQRATPLPIIDGKGMVVHSNYDEVNFAIDSNKYNLYERLNADRRLKDFTEFDDDEMKWNYPW